MLKKLLVLMLCFTCLKGTMKLSSPAFSHNGSIPSQYTCDGANVSPSLQWSDEPAGTKTFALIVDDPDAPAKVWVHWVVFNIPNTVRSFAEGASMNEFGAGATVLMAKPPTAARAHQADPTIITLPSMLLIPDLILLLVQPKNSCLLPCKAISSNKLLLSVLIKRRNKFMLLPSNQYYCWLKLPISL